jgi:hypothetical protein
MVKMCCETAIVRSVRTNIVSDPSCACGCPLEDAIHYLLECPLYTNVNIFCFPYIFKSTLI